MTNPAEKLPRKAAERTQQIPLRRRPKEESERPFHKLAEGQASENLYALKEFSEACRGVNLETFKERYPFPFLIQESALTKTQSNAGFVTNPNSTPASTRPVDLFQSAVFLVRKTAGSLFPHMITVGRSTNNDIVLEHGDISKFHAYFTRNDELWSVTDHGSTNGTFIGEIDLEEKTPSPLANNAELSFSDLTFRFVDNATMFNYVHYVLCILG